MDKLDALELFVDEFDLKLQSRESEENFLLKDAADEPPLDASDIVGFFKPLGYKVFILKHEQGLFTLNMQPCEVEEYDPTPCCYQHGVGAISTTDPCPSIADND